MILDDYRKRSRKVDLEYPDLKEDEKIELFALQELVDGERVINVTDIQLSDSQKEIFKKTSEISSSFIKIQKLYEMYISDYAEFNKDLNSIESELRDKKRSKFLLEDNFNRRLVHILSSAILFVTFFENEIKRKHGEKSWQHENWKKELGKVYDNEFAYRFGYHLRNYTQHEGLAIATISTALGNKNPEKKLTCILKINPKYLISTSYNWKKEIAVELKNLKEDIDVRYFLNNFFKSIALIYFIQSEIFLDSNHKLLIELREEHRKMYDEYKIPCLMQTSKRELRNGKMKTLKPLSGLSEITKIYLELSKIGLVNFEKTNNE